MALFVDIGIAGQSTIALKAERIEHMFIRSPIQIGLPTTAGGDPTTFSLDMGINIQHITISGLVDAADKAALEVAVKNWWDYGADSVSLPFMTIPSETGGDVYYGHIKQMSFSMTGGIEKFWTLDMIFVVREWV